MCNIYQPCVRRIPNTCATYTNRMWSTCKTYTWVICPNSVSLHSHMCLVCGVYVSHMRKAYVSQPVKSYFVEIRPYFGPDINSVPNTAQAKTFKKHKLNTNAAQNKHMCCFCVCAFFAHGLRIVCASFALCLCNCLRKLWNKALFCGKCKN